jgi:hypothetical protein
VVHGRIRKLHKLADELVTAVEDGLEEAEGGDTT